MKVLSLSIALSMLVSLPGFAAEPLEFSSDPGPALNIARSLMGQERGEPLRDDESLSIALMDLDADGTRDIIAFADASYFCGSAGCVPRLYRLERDTGHWSELPIEADATINGEPGMWSVGEKSASGWLTLQFTTPDLRLNFEWTGEAYVQVAR